MHEADDAYSIRSTWSCYWLDQFLTLALHILILSIFYISMDLSTNYFAHFSGCWASFACSCHYPRMPCHVFWSQAEYKIVCFISNKKIYLKYCWRWQYENHGFIFIPSGISFFCWHGGLRNLGGFGRFGSVFLSLFFCLLSLKNIKISNFILVYSLKHFECNNLILDFQNMFSLILFLWSENLNHSFIIILAYFPFRTCLTRIQQFD